MAIEMNSGGSNDLNRIIIPIRNLVRGPSKLGLTSTWRKKKMRRNLP